MGNFRELNVWQRAHDLTLAIYRLTPTFPPEERYGLTNQLRRSSASIPANLAEGSGRSSDRELYRFCAIALGSATELEYRLLLARDLRLIHPNDFDELTRQTTEVRRMLAGLRQSLKTKD